jgi:hypothetical protein
MDREDWEQEKEAFTGLTDNEYIIRFLGDYIHYHPPDENATDQYETYNILLEFGQRDLDDLFQTEPLPFPDTHEDFWDGLFDVAKAVREIHSFHDNAGKWAGFVTPFS